MALCVRLLFMLGLRRWTVVLVVHFMAHQIGDVTVGYN